MPQKTGYVLNEMFEDIKVFMERVSSSDQIKSSMFYSFGFALKLLRCYTMSAKNSTISHSLSFSKKAENVLAFSSHFVDFPQKTKNLSQRTKIPAKLFP